MFLKNWGPNAKVTKWPTMGKNAVLELLHYLMYQLAIIFNQISLLGVALSISKNFRSKSEIWRLPHEQILAKMQFWGHNSIQKHQVATFVSQKLYGGLSSISENLRSKGNHMIITGITQRSYVMVTTWSNMVQNTVLEVLTEIQKMFLVANLWPRHFESTCRQRHPINALDLSSI